MKHIKTAAIILLCFIMLCSCQPIHSIASLLSDNAPVAHNYASEYTHLWQYKLLPDELKAHYGHIYTVIKDSLSEETFVTLSNEGGQNVQKHGIRVSIPQAKMTRADVISVFEAFYDDHPQFFFIDRAYSMEGHQELNGDVYYDTLILEYTHSAQQRTEGLRELEDVALSILSGVPQTDDQYLIEQYIHDRLTAVCTYDTEVSGSEAEIRPIAYTAYGALVEGKAVCEGYAKAMQLLLNKVAIPVTLVTGTAKANDESHMWNLVTINGKNYHLDPTWNDSNDQQQYTYFNLTTDMVLLSYDIDEGQNLPLCSATEDNYFIRCSAYIDTYERDAIAERIADRIVAGNTTIQLRFAEGKFENGILFLKNEKLLRSMVNKHLSDTEYIMWDYSLWSEASQNVLTLIKE